MKRKTRWMTMLLAGCLAMSAVSALAWDETEAGQLDPAEMEAVEADGTEADAVETAELDAVIEQKEVAWSGTCGANVKWEFDGATMTIAGKGPMTDFPSREDRPWDAFVQSIKTVIIREGVTTVGDLSFSSSQGLRTVYLPVSMTYLGNGAFGYCHNLNNIYYAGTSAQAYAMDSGRKSFTNDPEWTYNVKPAPFADVSDPNAYYYAPVVWASEKEITMGTSLSRFSPKATCTREQVVTFLWRAAGCPKPKSTSMRFADVSSDSFAYQAILWAAENNITVGTSDHTFAPKNTVMREEFVTFLWRAAGKKNAGTANSFGDVPKDAYYADAVAWAAAMHVTAGTGNGNFSPKMSCSREQVVTFLYRYYVK